MHDTCARGHGLDFVGTQNVPFPHAVAMKQMPFEDIGDDLHIAMAMRPESLAGLDAVIVDDAQRAKADVRLAYAEIHAPINGFVDVRAARQGEVVNAGQPVVTLIDPDDLWIRADVEETYIDRLAIGRDLTVRLPSGEERQGRVFYRGADAGFATQRDVSRTKRDIRTFEVRLRVDNADRKLAAGMTAYVLLPLP